GHAVRPPALPDGELTEAAVLRLFEQAGGLRRGGLLVFRGRGGARSPDRGGGLRRGHFVLSSGRHGEIYLQCAVVLQWPRLAEALGRALAARARQAYGEVG